MELGEFLPKRSTDILSPDSHFKRTINEILMLGRAANLSINHIHW